MTVLQLGIFALAAIFIGQLKKGRDLVLLGASVFVIYWLQPPQQFVSLTFWIPTATLALTVFIWLLVSTPESRAWKTNFPAALTILGVILLIDLNQFFGFEKIYMTTTPRLWMIGVFIAAYFGFISLVNRWSSTSSARLDRIETNKNAAHKILSATLLVILLAFIYLKTPILITKSFDFLYSLRGQEPQPHYVLAWLGYSYIAFRLIHTIRDHQAGRLPALTLSEYVNYVIFFPSFTAGPIDRAERFVPELRNPVALTEQDWVEAGRRFFIGLFKKFVIADALALIAINDAMVSQKMSAGWLWFFLYAYSLRIYFDFSGYTDIAIGLARVMGIRLPENFAAPYLKPNLTQFWNSWHMTLTQWFRAYFFNPITRSLRTKNVSIPVIILITQISTMTLIGLWHGVSWGFVLWGLWHGLGLFLQNRWSEFIRPRMTNPLPPQRQWILSASGIFLTFNFVSLGWLFFTLSTPALAWTALLRLFGLN
jgi:D-alanyl-lipoteichoic acid acyltransferase DltB (MBOAT superfamily)